MNRTMTPGEWGLLLLLSILWGSSLFSLNIAAREVPAFTIVMAKVVLAAIPLVLVAGRRLRWNRRDWGGFAAMALFNDAGPFVLIAFAGPHIPTGLASVLIATNPLFTALLAHWLTRDEHMTIRHVAGVAIGFFGLAVMLGDGGFSLALPSVLAAGAFLLVSLAYSYASIFGRRFAAEKVHPMAVAAGQHCCSAVVIVPLALLMDRPWMLSMPSLPAIGALLALGLLSGALAYTIYYRVLATAGATNVVLVTFMSPVTTILMGLALLGERLSAQQGAGMALIALGLVVLDGRVLTWARASAA